LLKIAMNDKAKRMERRIALTKLLTDSPGRLFSLGYFSTMFGAAKSTLSEDVEAIQQALAEFGLGKLETVAGAAGGVRFLPYVSSQSTNEILTSLAETLASPERVLTGGFLYMSDLLFDAHIMARVGEVFMTCFAQSRPDCIMTVETKGIPLAMMTARAFNLPLAIARHGSKVTEGSAVSVYHVSGSNRRIQTMSLPKRAIAPGSRVLLIDDFMKAGGTARGMIDLVHEFDAAVVGLGVLIATEEPSQKLVDDYQALLILSDVDEHTKTVKIHSAL
jgi:purine operon repressor